MKKVIVAVMAVTMVITGATAVSASGHHRGMRDGSGICVMEDCPNNGHHRGCGERNPEYCPYR